MAYERLAATMENPHPPTEIIISADSHVMELPDMWQTRLPQSMRDRAPIFPPQNMAPGFKPHPGGFDPYERVREMAQDGVSAEVLYPTLGLKLFGMDDARLQEACFQAYNDWLIEYCRVSPDRLVGIGLISVYDIDHAIGELERCKQSGLLGAEIWQVPPPELSFLTDHYERFWAAAEAMGIPISLHILTGFNYSRSAQSFSGLELYRGSVNWKLVDVMNCLFDIMFTGVLDRFPKLKLVLVENEIGWIPFVLQQWDYYVRRFREANPPPMQGLPSDYFLRNVYATFFNDAVGGRSLGSWGTENFMWSSDYPHGNSTWPHSHDVIRRDLGHVSDEARNKLVRENVTKLYGIVPPTTPAVASAQ
jgi:predicted TIM-barrel fold metal-dependent hydrolase